MKYFIIAVLLFKSAIHFQYFLTSWPEFLRKTMEVSERYLITHKWAEPWKKGIDNLVHRTFELIYTGVCIYLAIHFWYA